MSFSSKISYICAPFFALFEKKNNVERYLVFEFHFTIMFLELRERKIKIPNEMSQNLMLLHSYILCKVR